MSISGKELVEQGEEMIQRGQDMIDQGREMDMGETVLMEGNEMKKHELLRRGREMVERGEEKVERGREMRKYDLLRNTKKELKLRLTETKKALDFWRLLGDVPVVVALIAVVGGWLALQSTGYTRITGDAVFNPLYYIEILFVHSGWDHFVANMYFFLTAGIVLTYLTNNRKVFVVMAVSHVSAVLVTGVWFERGMIGTAAAAYGMLAATAVRTTYIGSKRYSPSTQTSAPIGIFVVSGIGMLMMGTVAGGFLQNVPLIIGFMAGGALECVTVLSKTRGTSAADMNNTEKIGPPTQ